MPKPSWNRIIESEGPHAEGYLIALKNGWQDGHGSHVIRSTGKTKAHLLLEDCVACLCEACNQEIDALPSDYSAGTTDRFDIFVELFKRVYAARGCPVGPMLERCVDSALEATEAVIRIGDRWRK